MKKQQDGFTLVEVVIALVLMAVILTTLGGLTFVTARQAVVADNTMEREAASLELVNRYATMPFNQLALGTACDSAGTTNNLYRRCVTVTPLSTARRVVIVTTPEQRGVAPSTVTLVRNPPPSASPLCVSSC
jgi:prepilin-type N-terminal cleavage/methylation domain-containing protein